MSILLALGAGACAMVSVGAATAVELPSAGVSLPPGVADALGRVRRSLGERERRERVKADCMSEVPRMLDVVTLGLSAGLSFDASLELYCKRSDSALSGYLGEASLRWRLGIVTREVALLDLADEVGSPALRRFAAAVRESLEFGSPLADTLTRQADLIRLEQRLAVEERIERTPVKMLMPLGCLVMPAMLLAILGPLLSSALSSL